MKLPLLLAQFLYQHKKLALPGIGSFTLNPSTEVPQDTGDSEGKTIEGIEFDNQLVSHPDDELIDFIRRHTGKIKPLAAADLDSYLTLGIQLLNIGKPFYLDGIGAVTKSQEGAYHFVAGTFRTIKTEGATDERPDRSRAIFEEQHDDYQPRTNNLGRFLVVVSIIGGIILIGWGGYTLYQRNIYPDTLSQMPVRPADTTTIQKDSEAIQVASNVKKDSVIVKPTVFENAPRNVGDSQSLRFVILATSNKFRALKRYEQLMSYNLNIKMQTADSSFFKLYFAFPAKMKDTVRIKDSLNRIYAARVFIEK